MQRHVTGLKYERYLFPGELLVGAGRVSDIVTKYMAEIPYICSVNEKVKAHRQALLASLAPDNLKEFTRKRGQIHRERNAILRLIVRSVHYQAQVKSYGEKCSAAKFLDTVFRKLDITALFGYGYKKETGCLKVIFKELGNADITEAFSVLGIEQELERLKKIEEEFENINTEIEKIKAQVCTTVTESKSVLYAKVNLLLECANFSAEEEAERFAKCANELNETVKNLNAIAKSRVSRARNGNKKSHSEDSADGTNIINLPSKTNNNTYQETRPAIKRYFENPLIFRTLFLLYPGLFYLSLLFG